MLPIWPKVSDLFCFLLPITYFCSLLSGVCTQFYSKEFRHPVVCPKVANGEIAIFTHKGVTLGTIVCGMNMNL